MRKRIQQILIFTFHSGGVRVRQHQLVHDALNCQAVRNMSSYMTDTDDSYFSIIHFLISFYPCYIYPFKPAEEFAPFG